MHWLIGRLLARIEPDVLAWWESIDGAGDNA
jgi:hypothetical protein